MLCILIPLFGRVRLLCYFNLAGAIYDPDVVGHEVATISDARILASKFVSEIIRDKPEAVWMGEEIRVEVTEVLSV